MPVDKARIYDELLKLTIDLNFEDIPTPSYIQEKILDCNEYQRKVEKFFIEVTRELSSKERLYRCDKLNIEVKKRQTLTNNDKIKRIPTGKEREAAVDELLEQDYKNLLDLENDICSLKDLLTSIKTVQTNLKSTNSDIRVLAKVMEQQISRLNIGSKDDPEIKGLNTVLSDLNKLEEEMSVDDVESASESIKQDGSDDKSASESHNNATSEGDGQDTSNEIDFGDVISSFLVDDSSDFSAQSSEEESQDEKSPREESEEASTITDASEESKGDEASDSKVSLSLEDLGIDIDIEEATTKELEKAPPPTKIGMSVKDEPPVTKSKSPPDKVKPEAAPEGDKVVTKGSPKKEENLPTTNEKKNVTEIDIDDILNNL